MKRSLILTFALVALLALSLGSTGCESGSSAVYVGVHGGYGYGPGWGVGYHPGYYPGRPYGPYW